MRNDDETTKVALVTGAARRIGAALVRALHQDGYRVLIHYSGSRDDAERTVSMLNGLRPESAACLRADLREEGEIASLARRATDAWGRVDLLINNASTFYPTAVGETTFAQWDDLLGVNLRAPFFLIQALAGELRARRGAIVNITDIYAERPLAGHAPYTAAKAGLVNLTRSMAIDLAPEVRVNAIAPGAILWPEGAAGDEGREAVLRRTPLGRTGEPSDIVETMRFLVRDGGFITGQVIRVDGGRSVVP